MDIKDRIKTILITIVCVLGISFLVKGYMLIVHAKEPIIVTGHSMDPTFSNRQFLFVTKLNQKSLTGEYITLNELKQGDVVIVKKSKTEKIIKRLIGLPGDIVVIDPNGSIYVNGEMYPTKELLEDIPETIYYELDNDEYFILGDNINYSLDSTETGPVSGTDIVAVYK